MLKKYIRDIPDFPKKGIIFKDITTLLQNKKAFKKAVEMMSNLFRKYHPDVVVAVEARGFIFGAAVAYKLGCSLVPIRKKGKLPYKTYSYTYSLEYGKDTLQIHRDSFKPGSRVIIIDDLLATGGTTKAAIELVKKLQGKIIGISFLIELTFLDGRKKLKDYKVFSLIKY